MAGPDDRSPPSAFDHEGLDERGIPQVASAPRQPNWIVAAFGIGIVGLLLWFINKPDDEKAPELTDQQAKEFETAPRTEAPEIPKPAPAPEPEAPATTEQALLDPYERQYEAELRLLALKQAEEQRKLAEQRRRSPILIFNNQNEQAKLATAQLRPTAAGGLLAGAEQRPSASTSAARFAERVSNERVATAKASRIKNQGTVIPQGSLIRGILETAIQSDLPGFTRAEVAHDVYSFDGSRLLIPKGSRLVGKYQAGLVRGQTRVFIIWTRLLRPDGASILIGSPSTDVLGRAGIAGDLDTHFFKIFGASVLLSLIDGAIAVAIANAQDNDDSVFLNQSGASLNRAAEIALENSINIPPTIHIDQGTPIQVFVAKDLDFIDVEL